jgi:hypothetical protein
VSVELASKLGFECTDCGAHGVDDGHQLHDCHSESGFDASGLTQDGSFEPGENLLDQRWVVAPAAAMQDRDYASWSVPDFIDTD